jgi:cellulose synthase/poly-beta-1,6-N-acetylglucosamine synthase-like glycosyltransferase
MTQRGVAWIYAALTLVLYLLAALPSLLILQSGRTPYFVALALIYEFVSLGCALELSELILGLILSPPRHPHTDRSDIAMVKLAVLYVCCDDMDDESIEALLSIKNADVFVLDDSERNISKDSLDRTGLHIVRRGSRHGYKAGNLNHWLYKFGSYYDYFVILDNDSLMNTEAIWDLVTYAEHPENQGVAIIQSWISPRRGNLFQRSVGLFSATRARVLHRLYDRIGWSLSSGHNNLHRVRAIKDVGGFDLAATCEDTLLSLNLVRRGWRIMHVPTGSLDSEPDNALSYRRRHNRWARQTVEVIKASKTGLPLSQALLMGRHIVAHLLPLACVMLFILGILGTPNVTAREGWSILRGSFTATHGDMLAMMRYSAIFVFLSLAILRVVVCLIVRCRLLELLSSFLLGGALISFACFDTASGMLRSAVGRPVKFTPTGALAGAKSNLVDLTKSMLIPWTLYCLVTIRAFFSPGILVIGFNLLWCLILLSSPLLLWILQGCSIEGRNVD